MKRLPFRIRIALLSTLISGVVLAGFGWATWAQVHHLRVEALDRELRSLAMRHPGWFVNRGGYERLSSAMEFIFGEESAGRMILHVRGRDGLVLYQSPHWPEGWMPVPPAGATNAASSRVTGEDSRGGPGQALPAGGGRGGGRGMGMGHSGPPTITLVRPPEFRTLSHAGATWRLGIFESTESILLIGLDFVQLQSELERTRTVFLLALPAALLLIGLGGWLVARRALNPLETIAEAAERVTAKGLDQRIPWSDETPEIARLTRVLNRMMDRLETSFQQASRFSADASHQLKTPLAVMQAEIDSALQEAEPGSPCQQTMAGVLEQIRTLKSITRSLLLLSQSDAGRLPLARVPLDLGAELETLMEDARALMEGTALELRADVPPGVWVDGDRGLLGMAMLNLLDNAVKHSDGTGIVHVCLSRTAEHAVLKVRNPGQGIAPEDRNRIFDRFYRGQGTGPTRREGAGLGLSLGREIARAHGGDLALGPAEAGWTEFVLTLPAIHQEHPASLK